MHRTHHRAPVKRDSWYIGWKEKLGASGGVKELEHRELGGKKNSARVNERESTGEKFTSSFFFFEKLREYPIDKISETKLRIERN